MRAPSFAGTNSITTEPGGAGPVVVARGELDVAEVPALRAELERATARGARRLLLDFEQVTFVDSISLAAVVAARRRMGEDGKVVIATGQPYALLILEAGGLDSVIDVRPSRAEAEAALLE